MIQHDNTGKIFWISLVVSLLVSSIVSLVMILFVAPHLQGIMGNTNASVEKIDVPAVVNLPVDQAKVIAQNKGLNIIIESTKESETLPENYIISQDPLPGIPADKGDVIKVVVSTGKPEVVEKEKPAEEVLLPYLRGLTLEEAENKIVSMGLIIGDVVYRTSSTISPNHVIQTDPPGGSKIIKGSAVNITVSKEEAKVTVPRLYGKTISRARQLLESKGLRLGSVYHTTDTEKPFDIIISQSPSAGTKVKKGTKVSVTLNVEAY